MQYTYLMYNGKHYKIGRSINPEKRYLELKVASPELKIIAYGTGIDEKTLHEKCNNKKISGEWFKLKAKDVSKIIQLLNNEFNGFVKTNEIIKAEQRINKNKDFHKKLWDKYSKYIINFGKYKDICIIDMTSIEQIKYIKWGLKNFGKKSKAYKVFNWWINEQYNPNRLH